MNTLIREGHPIRCPFALIIDAATDDFVIDPLGPVNGMPTPLVRQRGRLTPWHYDGGLMTSTLEIDLREIRTPAGVLRYYDTGDGPPLLFLHGSGPGVTGWRNFRGVLPTFAAHFRCLVLEFPVSGSAMTSAGTRC